MSANLETILQTAQQLPVSDQRELAERLLKELQNKESEEIEEALAIVEETFGSIGKDLDRETLIHFAEDEEFCGY